MDQLKVMREEIMETFKPMKMGEAPRPCDIHTKIILGSGIEMFIRLRRKIQDGERMPADWTTSASVYNFEEKEIG